MSYRQIYYQIVFSTYQRKPTIAEAHCEELYRDVWKIVKDHNCKLHRVNGTEDHIHIFAICIRASPWQILSRISKSKAAFG